MPIGRECCGGLIEVPIVAVLREDHRTDQRALGDPAAQVRTRAISHLERGRHRGTPTTGNVVRTTTRGPGRIRTCAHGSGARNSIRRKGQIGDNCIDARGIASSPVEVERDDRVDRRVQLLDNPESTGYDPCSARNARAVS